MIDRCPNKALLNLYAEIMRLDEAGTAVPCVRRVNWEALQVQSQINICKRCPVIDECRKAAEENGGTYGVWGGVEYTAGKALRNVKREK